MAYPKSDGTEVLALIPTQYSCEMYSEYLYRNAVDTLCAEDLTKAIIVPQGITLVEFCEANYPGRFNILANQNKLEVFKYKLNTEYTDLLLLEQELSVHETMLLDAETADKLFDDLLAKGYGKAYKRDTARLHAFCNGLVAERHSGSYRYAPAVWKVCIDPARAQKILKIRARPSINKPKRKKLQLTMHRLVSVGFKLRDFIFSSLRLDDISHIVWAGSHWRGFYSNSWSICIRSLQEIMKFISHNKSRLPMHKLRIKGGLALIPLIEDRIARMCKKPVPATEFNKDASTDFQIKVLRSLCNLLKKYGTKPTSGGARNV